MSDERFHRHLALGSQMAFNVRKNYCFSVLVRWCFRLTTSCSKFIKNIRPLPKALGDRNGLCEMGRSYKQEKSNYLQGEKNIVEAELRSIKGAYFRLKDQVQSLALELSSMEKALEASYNQVIPLRKELFPAEDS